MFRLLCLILLAINIADQLVAAGCNLSMMDNALVGSINCDLVKLREVFNKISCDDAGENAKIENCLRNCDGCGKAILCIKNELGLTRPNASVVNKCASTITNALTKFAGRKVF